MMSSKHAHRLEDLRPEGLAHLDQPLVPLLEDAGVQAIEEATARGVSINATVSFTVANAVAVAALVQRDPQLLEHAGVLRADESHGEQHQLAVDLELAAGDLDHLRPSVLGAAPFESNAVELPHLAVRISRYDSHASLTSLVSMELSRWLCLSVVMSPCCLLTYLTVPLGMEKQVS